MPGRVELRPGNLPTELDSFVGRRHELAEIRRLLNRFSFVTLTGPGGVGKTRLALRAAVEVERTFPDGVWLVRLSDVQDPELVEQAVATTLGLRKESIETPHQSLAEYLADRRLLLAVDNCEHVMQPVVRLAATLVAECPDVRMLATSRAELGVHRESTMQVLPLTLPEVDRPPGPEALQQYGAVNLLADRARAVAPGFDVTDENKEAIVRIVHQLDGVPLAIELAAARLRVLSPAELSDGLSDRYRLLTAGRRGAPDRHQTMRLCIDWSYHHCCAKEQTLWRRLSVFVGGFELDALEGVCAFGDLEAAEVLDVLDSLVQKSILSGSGSGEGARLRMLELLRDYGLERRDESGESPVVRARHRDWFIELTRRAKSEQLSAAQFGWWRRFDRELPNIRAAFDYALVEPGEPGTSVRLVSRLCDYWSSRGLTTEARRCVSRALAQRDARPDRDFVAVGYFAAVFAALQADLEAAKQWVQECRKLAAGLDPVCSAISEGAEGVVALCTGDLETASTRLRRATDVFRANDEPGWLVETLFYLGATAGLHGDNELVAECHHEILAITEPRGELWNQSYALWVYGLAIWRSGDHAHATQLMVDALRLMAELGDIDGSVRCLHTLAFVAASAEEPERAAVLLGAAAELSHGVGFTLVTTITGDDYVECKRQAREALGGTAYDDAFDRGRSMAFSEVIAFATGAAPQTTDQAEPRASVLTAREREVAELVAQGLTNKEIAAKLVVSERTAEGHVARILNKLGLYSRTQVTAWYVERRQ